VRALPTWSNPVGEGAKRTRESVVVMSVLMIAREGVCRAMLTEAMQADEPVRRVLQQG